MIRLEELRTADYADHEGDATGDQEPCAICGRPVNRPDDQPMVCIVGYGAGFAQMTPDGGEDGGADSLGWFPVGRACARKAQRLGVIVR